MKRWQDTPRRYIFLNTCGFSAISAMRAICRLRRRYPQLRAELDEQHEFLKRALKEQNTKKETGL